MAAMALLNTNCNPGLRVLRSSVGLNRRNHPQTATITDIVTHIVGEATPSEYALRILQVSTFLWKFFFSGFFFLVNCDG
jgi:hypothetical protein